MSESDSTKRRRSKQIKDQKVPISKIGLCVIALAHGIKPADWLRQRARYTERHANRVIGGTRKPSWRAIRAVIDEISE